MPERRRPTLDWRIVAAAIAVLGVLAGGTLLATQVETDLEQGVDERFGEVPFERPTDSPPLKLNDFRLPKDVPIDVPPGAQFSPDLSQLTLPEDIDLKLLEDLDLSDIDFELPEDLDLQLPEGTEFSPPGLKLPNGATIKLPDGREFKLPPGSDLDLAPEVVQRLLDQGLPAGVLPKARNISLRDLPPDLTAKLGAPEFSGPGHLRLPGGTTITLPDGQRFPFPPGVLPYAARYLLPAGTTFDIPFDATTARGGEIPLPQPYASTQLRDDGRANVTARIGVDTEITGMPSRVRKGEPVVVSGYVREASTGRPIAGAPVDIFMNESKRVAGVLVGQGVSDAQGGFKLALEIPTDKPARDYQLVNHAAAFVDARGRSYGDGWGDPPFSTYASTQLSLTVPLRDGQGASSVLNGTLLDNTGAPVSGVQVAVSVDGVVVRRPVTDAQGRFSAEYVFPVGTHSVEARFAGSANYEASNMARGTVTIDDYAIEVAPVLRAKVGDGLLLSGRVLGKGAVAPERVVTIDGLFGAPTVRLVTDSAGRFSYSHTPGTQAPGSYMLVYRAPDFNVTKLQLVEVNASGRLELGAPSQWDVEEPMPVQLALGTASGGRPLAGQTIRMSFSGPGGTRDITLVTDSGGVATATISPLRAAPGAYTLSARAVGNPYLDAPAVSQTISLSTFDVTWQLPSSVVRGEEASGALTVRFGNRAFANQSMTLDLFGPQQVRSDANGRVAWTTTVPKDTKLGATAVTLQALDHPLRSASTQVVAVPKLALDAPDAFEAGTPVEASLTLTDDQGAPLRNSRVTLVARSADAIARTVVTTDSAGRWRGPVNVSAEEGNVTLVARFDAASPYLGAEGAQTMVARPPESASVANYIWLLPLVGVVAAGSAGAAWYAAKKRAKPAALAPAPLAPVAPALPAELGVRFGIPSDEPPVWGVGDPLALTVENRGPAGDIELSWAGGTHAAFLAPGAHATTSLAFPQEGEVAIAARRRGSEATPATASVRIVDYRKETAREFDVFLEKARAIDASLTRQSTPREIVWTLAARLGAPAESHLDEVALVMEVTNYSHYAVSRDHYLRFVRAARALDPLFKPEA